MSEKGRCVGASPALPAMGQGSRMRGICQRLRMEQFCEPPIPCGHGIPGGQSDYLLSQKTVKKETGQSQGEGLGKEYAAKNDWDRLK